MGTELTRGEPELAGQRLSLSDVRNGTCGHPGLPEENHMTSLAFTRSGAGAPLVLLHGLGLSRQSWNPVIAALAVRFEVIAVDLPGFGDSNRRSGG
jgi:pimeloyl-ACP methyl ester carboxylesterase